jgi:hypothetical protein
MANSLPAKAKVGVPGKSVSINPATYFLARRMETAGMLNRGQALMLAATVSNTKPKKKGVRT